MPCKLSRAFVKYLYSYITSSHLSEFSSLLAFNQSGGLLSWRLVRLGIFDLDCDWRSLRLGVIVTGVLDRSDVGGAQEPGARADLAARGSGEWVPYWDWSRERVCSLPTPLKQSYPLPSSQMVGAIPTSYVAASSEIRNSYPTYPALTVMVVSVSLSLRDPPPQPGSPHPS